MMKNIRCLQKIRRIQLFQSNNVSVLTILAELNSLLDMDKKENEIVDGERDDSDEREPDRAVGRDVR